MWLNLQSSGVGLPSPEGWHRACAGVWVRKELPLLPPFGSKSSLFLTPAWLKCFWLRESLRVTLWTASIPNLSAPSRPGRFRDCQMLGLSEGGWLTVGAHRQAVSPLVRRRK
jgi:hypothetical protein